MSVRLRHPNGQIRSVPTDIYERTREFWQRRGYSMASGEEVVAESAATQPEPDAMQMSGEVATAKASPEAPRRFEREENAIEELMTLKGVGEERARMFVRVGWYTKDDLRRAGRDGLIRKASIGEKLADDLLAQLEE